MKLFFAATHIQTLPAGHRFPIGKYELLRQRLAADMPQLGLLLADPATEGELALVHSPLYVESVFKGNLPPLAQREIGFPWSEGMVERARRSVGATVMAARTAFQEGVAANLAGGTHHAYADKGGGFCVFNDVAVAARLIQAEWGRQQRGALQVAVIDLDVHQGNGTAHIFRNEPRVFTFSMHGAKNFPLRKEVSDLDIGLPDNTDDWTYLHLLKKTLPGLIEKVQPELVFYLSGVDVLESDKLGRLSLSAQGCRERDWYVLKTCKENNLPVVVSMGGGYSERLALIVEAHANTFRAAQEIFF